VGELVGLRWNDVDLAQRLLRLSHLRSGRSGVHHLTEEEVRALGNLLPPSSPARPASPYVFNTERQGPMTAAAFRKQLAAAARTAGIPFPVHPHMLRHTCGFELARQGHDRRSIGAWLGHRDARHATRYDASAA
jgi:type 1 fimbriae regulatory protein FimB/type 1 fimbriae regulatory protein FimE